MKYFIIPIILLLNIGCLLINLILHWIPRELIYFIHCAVAMGLYLIDKEINYE